MREMTIPTPTTLVEFLFRQVFELSGGMCRDGHFFPNPFEQKTNKRDWAILMREGCTFADCRMCLCGRKYALIVEFALVEQLFRQLGGALAGK